MATRRKDGYLRQCVTIKGKKYYCYGKTRKELREKVEKKRKEIEEASFCAGKNLTVEEFGRRWIDNKRNTVKSTTIRNHNIIVKRMCECEIDGAGNLFGSLKLVEVEPEHVREVQRRLDANGYHTATTNSTINEIRSLFKDAINDRLVAFNPASGVKPLKRREEEARDTCHRALTDEEIKLFFEAAKDSWYYDMFCFLINTGLRCGEAGALRYDDVKDGKITVKRTLTRQEDARFVIGQDAKTKAGQRTIPLTDAAKEALDRQKRFNIQTQGASIFEGDHLFFSNAKGGVADSNHVSQQIRSICKKAGIQSFGVHAFRDTFATRAAASGMQPKTLQEILGHSDIRITLNLYTHVLEEQKVDEMNRVSIAI